MSQEDIDATKAPLLEHLVELRRRLLWSVVSLLIAVIGCYVFAADIYRLLTLPLVGGDGVPRPGSGADLHRPA